MTDFRQIEWDAAVELDCRALVRLALEEDLAGQQDWTTVALVPAEREATASVVAREAGIAAGLAAVATIISEAKVRLVADCHIADGQQFAAQAKLITLKGKARDLLTVERTLLNFLGRMLGIATLTGRFVAELEGSSARIYDTRKTTPGWRRLEKYAVRCGGGTNHRQGLYDAVLIKDNHLAQRSGKSRGIPADAAVAVLEVRQFLQSPQGAAMSKPLLVEIEVDSLEQLTVVLSASPDIVLLDNMSPDMLLSAVQLRDQLAPQVELEASGGVRLETLREIASTGVDRISAGALTHSARSLDIGLDWVGV